MISDNAMHLDMHDCHVMLRIFIPCDLQGNIEPDPKEHGGRHGTHIEPGDSGGPGK